MAFAFRIFGALAILSIAGAFVFVLLRARAIKRRHLRVLDAAFPPMEELGSEGRRVYESEAALYHGSRFADGASFLEPAYRAPCVGDLFCSEKALFLKRETGSAEVLRVPWLVWPLDAIDEVTLVRGFAPLAGKELPILRLRWSRGGESLLSELSLRGGMEQLERLRRELHLRQRDGAALVQLGKLQAASLPEPKP